MIGEMYSVSMKDNFDAEVKKCILRFIDKRGVVPTQLDVRPEMQSNIDADILQQLKIRLVVRENGLAPGTFYLW